MKQQMYVLKNAKGVILRVEERRPIDYKDEPQKPVEVPYSASSKVKDIGD